MSNIACAGVVLVLPDGRWVMQRRTDDAPTDPNGLTFFGGRQEPGETAQQCFERELQEETNLDLAKHTYSQVAEFEVAHHGRPLHVTLFRMPIASMDFAVYEGKWAEAFTTQELAKRTDVASVVPKAIKILTEKK
ncbi:MAG TPA: NUDIX hydrolase [Candidatus Saccharimonadales bacterium]|nr:NUDIX hydrolase [Candidatus Saccharimonadales bacterium]